MNENKRVKRIVMKPLDVCRQVVRESQFCKFKPIKSHTGDTHFVLVQSYTENDWDIDEFDAEEVGIDVVPTVWTLLDAFSASVVCQVYDAVSNSSKIKLQQLSLIHLTKVCMRAMRNNNAETKNS